MAYTVQSHKIGDLVQAPDLAQIQALAGYEDKILIGTANGQLLLIQYTPTNQLSVLHHNQNFSSAAILQLEVKSIDKFVISLSSSLVQIHQIKDDYTIVPFVTDSQMTKGASIFACNQFQSENSFLQVCFADGQMVRLLRMKNNTLEQFQKPIKLESTAKNMVWWKSSICIGTLSNGYLLYDVSSIFHEICIVRM